jgi:predicted metal-dependent peptidase
MRERIAHLLERWFISEPALFQVLCTHSIEENAGMPCPVRSGARKLEYNPDFLKEMSDMALDQALRTEAIRILLKHPYQRKPDACSQQAIAVGSNLTIGDNYLFGSINIERPKDYKLPDGQAYEWYSRRIQELLPPGADGDGDSASGGNPSANSSKSDRSDTSDERTDRLAGNAEKNTALSALWDEDELAVAMIDGIIEGCKEWGSLAGNFAEKLKASAKARINWRNVLSGFRASILSTQRKLTRMRPNRRTGFENMGSIRRFDTRLLVAVDVSGSISSKDLAYFYGVVNSAFRYGFTAVDVIQFDAGVRVVQSLKKVLRDVVVLGRGGTSFEEPIEFAHENGYDGLVILTDGYAPEPVLPDNMRCKLVWVCNDRESYEHSHRWMEKSGRVCTMELK